jgi:hypothetical protein
MWPEVADGWEYHSRHIGDLFGKPFFRETTSLMMNLKITNTAWSCVAAAVILTAILWPHRLLSHETVNTTVTFDKEIVRILNRKCIACHSDNNLGIPFTSYEQTRPWARAIEEEVLRRHMPPWRAVRGYGQFANDLALTNREQQFIVAWVEGNGPKTKEQRLIVNVDQGRTAEADRLKPDFTTWQLGKPDLLKPIETYTVNPGQEDGVRRVLINLELSADHWIRAFDYKPTDRRAVRAVFFSLRETGQWLGSWTPWYGTTVLPSPMAYRIPANSHIVAEIHYQSATEKVDDAGTLGIYWAPGPAKNSPTDLVLEAKAAGAGIATSVGTSKDTSFATNKNFSTSVKLPASISILAFKPDLPPGIESFEVRAKRPDGTVQVLLLLRDILTRWPTPYILKEPVKLPVNSELSFTAYYASATSGQLPASVKLTASVVRAAPDSH